MDKNILEEYGVLREKISKMKDEKKSSIKLMIKKVERVEKLLSFRAKELVKQLSFLQREEKELISVKNSSKNENKNENNIFSFY